MIFSAQFQVPGQKRIENGITGTVVDTSRHCRPGHDRDPRARATRGGRSTPPSSPISHLGYAVHVYKGQGITAETSGILTGGWQTDREHAYVALSRAREQTQIYVSREDLGEAGMDIGAIERLAERMRRSGAQEASIAREVAEQAVERAARLERDIQSRSGVRDRVAVRFPRRTPQIVARDHKDNTLDQRFRMASPPFFGISAALGGSTVRVWASGLMWLSWSSSAYLSR